MRGGEIVYYTVVVSSFVINMGGGKSKCRSRALCCAPVLALQEVILDRQQTLSPTSCLSYPSGDALLSSDRAFGESAENDYLLHSKPGNFGAQRASGYNYQRLPRLEGLCASGFSY